VETRQPLINLFTTANFINLRIDLGTNI